MPNPTPTTFEAAADAWRAADALAEPAAKLAALDAAALAMVAAVPDDAPDALTQADREALHAAAGAAVAGDLGALRKLRGDERIRARLPTPEAEPLPAQTWTAQDPPPREWIVPGVLPAGRLASLYGAGAAGKSGLALQLCAAVMHGGAPLSAPPGASRDDADALANEHAMLRPLPGDAGRVLWLTWEDEVSEFIRRWRMAHHAGAVAAQYPDPARLTLVDMRKLGGPLWGPGEGLHVSTRAGWTAAGERFRRSLDGHRLAVVDPLAAAFASSEIDRSLVRAFTSAIDAAAEAAGCAVLLIAHPSQSGGVRGGGGYSGSTDWQAAVRAMLRLEVDAGTGHCVGAKEPAKAHRLTNAKQSYAADGGHLWLVRHFAQPAAEDGGRAPAQLAWFGARAGRAAEAFELAEAKRAGRKARDVQSLNERPPQIGEIV